MHDINGAVFSKKKEADLGIIAAGNQPQNYCRKEAQVKGISSMITPSCLKSPNLIWNRWLRIRVLRELGRRERRPKGELSQKKKLLMPKTTRPKQTEASGEGPKVSPKNLQKSRTVRASFVRSGNTFFSPWGGKDQRGYALRLFKHDGLSMDGAEKTGKPHHHRWGSQIGSGFLCQGNEGTNEARKVRLGLNSRGGEYDMVHSRNEIMKREKRLAVQISWNGERGSAAES